MPRPLALVAILPLLVACSSARPEVALLAEAVEQFHRASNADRPARADALARVACRDAEVCAARAACVEATAATAAALRSKQEAEAIVAELEAGKRTSGDPSVQGLPAKLDEASQLLKKGHEIMPLCDHKVLVLRERYGL